MPEPYELVRARCRRARLETLDDRERRWSFIPAEPWQEGFHRIVIRATIEDLAGNNIGKTFDVDLASGGPRSPLPARPTWPR